MKPCISFLRDSSLQFLQFKMSFRGEIVGGDFKSVTLRTTIPSSSVSSRRKQIRHAQDFALRRCDAGTDLYIAHRPVSMAFKSVF